MPSYLHPRSTATSTLFAGTLLASFIVVGIPHVFPCPRPRKGYADSEIIVDEQGRPIRRIRRQTKDGTHLEQDESSKASPASFLLEETDSKIPQTASERKLAKTLEQEAELFRQLQAEAALLEKERRECPVPKPKGMIGRLLGFQASDEKKDEPTRSGKK